MEHMESILAGFAHIRTDGRVRRIRTGELPRVHLRYVTFLIATTSHANTHTHQAWHRERQLERAWRAQQ